MKRLNKINKKILFVLILFISIGFAYLTRDLTLSGISSIFGNTWDVHFDNVVVTSGCAEANTPVIDTDRTSVSFTVEFSTPGDFYEFTVDAVNGGTIDAMLNTYTSSELDESIANLLEYTVTYADGEELAQYQELNAGDSLTYKIRLYYKLDISEDDLPDSNIPVEITFTTDYVQADSNRIQRYAETHSLYNVLKNEAESGGLAKKYTGAHQDSMDASKSTKDIYHWYADNDTDGTAVTNKNNVIFANHCWQMIRTTDTGGTKLLYNGEVENNQCLNTRGTHVGYASGESQNLASNYWYGTDYIFDSASNTFQLSGDITTGEVKVGQYTCKSSSVNDTCSELYYVISSYGGSSYNVLLLNSSSHYSQFGKIYYNSPNNSPSYVGYMYNKSYSYHKKNNYKETILSSDSLSISYWYADSYVLNGSSNYVLDNPFKVSSASDFSNLVGKYTLSSDSSSQSSSYIMYIVGINNSTMYYIKIDNGNNLEYYNYLYSYGDSYTDNGDGTYSIDNPININRTDWYNNYNTIGKYKYFCKNATNNICSDLWYLTYNSPTYTNYIKIDDNFKYSKSFNWDGSKYILNDHDSVSFWNIYDNDNRTSLNNAHYTCFNSSGVCTSLSYIYSYFPGITHYIILDNGKSIEDAKNEMFYNNDVNTIDSNIKIGVEAWFANYLIRYSNYLEDTIFCNDRTQSNSATNGWNPDGGKYSTLMYFGNSNDLMCNNITDKFSTLNDMAKLKYKVGLMTYPELKLLNHKNILSTGEFYWLGSPRQFYFDEFVISIVRSDGDLANSTNEYPRFFGLRPTVSLKPGISYSSGNGSMETPYIVDSN